MARRFLPWIGPAIFLVLAVFLYTGIPGFYFSAYICAGISLVYSVYILLFRNKNKKFAKVLIRVLTLCLCLGLLAATFTGVLIYRGGLPQENADPEYIIVLGAGLHGSTPSMILTERLQTASQYLHSHPNAIAVVSGGQGHGEDIPESQAMFDYLVRAGIGADRIWQENQSTNTRENLRFSLDVIENRTGSRPETAGILSNEFHLYRAGFFAREQNLTPIPIPAKTTWFALYANYFLREIVAVWYYVLLGG